MVLISRLHFDKGTAAEVQKFIDGADVNWERFRRMIKAHQVRPFIYQLIKANGLRVPPPFLRALQNEVFKTGAAGLHQLRYLKSVIQDLGDLGIKVIPYKGVLFGARYYKSSTLRESTDIDLFVDKADVKEIRSYFHRHGYMVKEDVPDDFLNYFLLFYRDISFKTPPDALDISCTVEIQWRLVDGFVGNYAGFDFFSKHLEDVDAGGSKIPGLSTTDDFLCVISNHFFKEHLNRFKYVVDIACLLSLKQAEIDKAVVAEMVRRYRFSNFFNDSVQCIDDLLGVKYTGGDKCSRHYATILNNAVTYPVGRNKKNDRVVFDLQNSFADKMLLIARRLLYFMSPNYNDIAAFKGSALFLPFLFIAKPVRLVLNSFSKKKPGK